MIDSVLGWKNQTVYSPSCGRTAANVCRAGRLGTPGRISCRRNVRTSINEWLIPCTHRYFLVSGLGHVVKGGNVVAVLEPGCYFGEVGCLLSDIRHASVIATTYSELYSLLKADLLEIMVDYPVFAAELRQSALNSLQHDHDRVKSGNMQPAKENRDVALQREAILSSTGYISPKDSRIAFTDDTRHALDESWLKLHESLTQKVHEAEAKTVNAINDLIAQYST